MKTRRSIAGFTVVELLVVIAIAAILAGIILWQFGRLRDIQLLRGNTEAVLALVAEARTKTLASIGGSQYGVYFQSDRATLFKGSTFPGASDPNNAVESLNSRLTISSITLLGGGQSVVFQRLSGKTSQSGTITINLVSDSATKKVITIGSNGIAGAN